MLNPEMTALAGTVLDLCRARGLHIATVESCTGGLVGAALTSIAGSSDVVDRGFITYTNLAKTEQVGVPEALLATPGPGAVSEEVARAMAEGGIAHSNAEIAVSLTGVAGPGGGSAEKPVGLVHLACARSGRATLHQRHVFPGDRGNVCEAAVMTALRMIVAQAG